MLTTRATKTDPKIAVLRELFGFAGPGDRELLALAALFDEVRVEPGECLIREGEPGREVFLIVDGQAAVSLHDKPLGTVGPGEFVGEMTLFERAPRSATVTALTPVRTLVAGAQSFGTLLNDAAVLRRLAATLARRLRASQGSPTDWPAA
jgi:CRP/FNR family transcriptional regulator, cyclic AMP receptor protein